jgi:hypothetical protein
MADDTVELELTPKSKQTKAALKDELVFELSSKTAIDWDKLESQLRFDIQIDWDILQTTQKYYEQAEFVLYRINTWDPSTPPVFVINTSDLTQSLTTELEELKNIDPMGFDKIVTEAVQTIMEGINRRYYHIAALPYKVTWRFES